MNKIILLQMIALLSGVVIGLHLDLDFWLLTYND